MEKTFDLLSIGDATVDIFLTLNKINDYCRLDKEKNELCLKYGGKILADDSHFLLGGNGCNVAVGVSRLNVNTAFISELGDDEFADIVLKGLQKENVNTTLVKQTAGLRTNFAVILTFEQDKVLFARHIPRDHGFSFDGISAKWVYLTSMGQKWKEAYKNTLDFARRTGCKLVFNPGTTQINEGTESFADVLAAADILFINKQEAVEIFNFQYTIFNEDSMKEMLLRIKEKGPKAVVVTDNNNGSYAMDEAGQIYYIGVFPATVVQKTGAGDAYTSGFLSATVLGKPIDEAMRWGAINSSGVIQKIGAQPGLLTRGEMEKKLEENMEFQAKEIESFAGPVSSRLQAFPTLAGDHRSLPPADKVL